MSGCRSAQAASSSPNQRPFTSSIPRAWWNSSETWPLETNRPFTVNWDWKPKAKGRAAYSAQATDSIQSNPRRAR